VLIPGSLVEKEQPSRTKILLCTLGENDTGAIVEKYRTL